MHPDFSGRKLHGWKLIDPGPRNLSCKVRMGFLQSFVQQSEGWQYLPFANHCPACGCLQYWFAIFNAPVLRVAYQFNLALLSSRLLAQIVQWMPRKCVGPGFNPWTRAKLSSRGTCTSIVQQSGGWESFPFKKPSPPNGLPHNWFTIFNRLCFKND